MYLFLYEYVCGLNMPWGTCHGQRMTPKNQFSFHHIERVKLRFGGTHP